MNDPVKTGPIKTGPVQTGRLLLISESVGTPTPARGILNYSAGLLACCKRLGVETTLLAETPETIASSATDIVRFLVEGTYDGAIRHKPHWKHLYVKYVQALRERGTRTAPAPVPSRAFVPAHASALPEMEKVAPHLAWVDAFMPVARFYSDSTLQASYDLPPPIVDARGFDFVLMDAFHYAHPLTDKGARVMLVIHDLIPLDELAGRYRFTFDQKFRTALERATELIFVSAATREEFGRRFPDHAARLPWSVFSPVIRPDLQAASQTASTGPKPERPRFVSILSNEPRKNIALLVDAFAKMGDRAELVIIGSVPARSFPDAGSNVQFVGQVTEDQKTELLHSASALVFPSLSEGFGIPIVEGALFGLPVVCSDLPVFREIAGDLAIFFDPRSVASLARRLDEVASNPAGFHQQATFLRDRCIASYGADAATARLAKLLGLQQAS
jgi:glycosyltransferase involved in cell wall biosynthesis